MNAIERHDAPDSDFGRTVEITEYERPSGQDEAVTGQSIAMMQAITLRDAASPAVIAAAHLAIAEANLAPDATLEEIATLAIFPWVKRHVEYKPEGDLKTPFNHRRGIVDQTLITPAALLAMPRPYGDCPQFSMLTAALCRFWHIPSAFKSIAADPDQPDTYTHVYCVSQPAPGRFVPLDTSNAPGPDLEYAHPTKSRMWPNHQDTKEEAMIRNTRHNQDRIRRLRTMPARLGYLDDEGNYVPDPSPAPDLIPAGTYAAGYTDPYAPAPSVAPPAPAAPGTNWANLFGVIATDATKIAAPLIASANRQTPYYIQGAGGAQVLYDPNTGTVATAKTTSTTDLAAGVRAVTSAIPSTYLLFGALAIGAIILIPALSKK